MGFDALQRMDVCLRPDPSRVLIRFFAPHSSDRIERVLARIMVLDEATIQKRLAFVMEYFEERHSNIRPILIRHYDKVASHMSTDLEPSEPRKLLLGAYFTSEFAMESAALFNPSIVPHPDQSGLQEGALRIVLSLRATGEGHISSVEFRCGVIDSDFNIHIEDPGDFVTEPEIIQNPTYDKKVFSLKLYELGYKNDTTRKILSGLSEAFSLEQLLSRIDEVLQASPYRSRSFGETLTAIRSLAEANYEVCFSTDQPLAERVIFPHMGQGRKSIEDARFVCFDHGEDGGSTYYATYTAYDGHTFLPQLLETKDFTHFRFITLNGEGVQNKGMALFPRQINGRYAMLSRQDNENIFIMFSDSIHFWHERQLVMKPSFPWEYVQLGNCGSPIEIDEGWLVLTHGVGAMRRYCIGAILLDRDDPTRVIGRLEEPLLEPNENEREGYVPNVVYTCGGLVHQDKLVVPYAMSDYATSIARVDLQQLVQALKSK